MSTAHPVSETAVEHQIPPRRARFKQVVVGAHVAALVAVALIIALHASPAGTSVRSIDAAAAPATTAAPAAAAMVAPPPAAAAPAASAPASSAPADAASVDNVDLAVATGGDCRIKAMRLAQGDAGDDVTCLQQGLVNAGYLQAAQVNGQFDPATYTAVEKVQTERDLFVDGIVGRETAISLNVWPDEQSFVVHTPPPAPGAEDSMGFRLSSVASTGADAPPLPENSGSGRRVVYDRRSQRVWAVSEDGEIIRSWLVSGSKYGNEQPGEHRVFSRSEVSTAWNGRAYLPLMIRYQKTAIGNIGFHGIPTHVADGSAYMTEDQLGTRLSGGCQRQANLDAKFMWAFATVGTKIVVT
jgi:lipoprotein-anchoring transpeptidase ErfK/SrfK